jgi:hypothetical protein
MFFSIFRKTSLWILSGSSAVQFPTVLPGHSYLEDKVLSVVLHIKPKSNFLAQNIVQCDVLLQYEFDKSVSEYHG